MSKALKHRLKKLEAAFLADVKPLNEFALNCTAEYLGVEDLNIEVTTKDFLRLYHNALMHSYMNEKGISAEDLPRGFHPVPDIPQRWDDIEVSA